MRRLKIGPYMLTLCSQSRGKLSNAGMLEILVRNVTGSALSTAGKGPHPMPEYPGLDPDFSTSNLAFHECMWWRADEDLGPSLPCKRPGAVLNSWLCVGSAVAVVISWGGKQKSSSPLTLLNK